MTLGYALHDSPAGVLVWFVGKLKAWSDNYPWTNEQLIYWAFMHYQGSPSAAMQIYKEAQAVLMRTKTACLAGIFLSLLVVRFSQKRYVHVRMAVTRTNLSSSSFGFILGVG